MAPKIIYFNVYYTTATHINWDRLWDTDNQAAINDTLGTTWVQSPDGGEEGKDDPNGLIDSFSMRQPSHPFSLPPHPNYSASREKKNQFLKLEALIACGDSGQILLD